MDEPPERVSSSQPLASSPPARTTIPWRAGWAIAARRALLTFAVAGAAAESIVFLLALADPRPGPDPATIAGGGGALLYAFHHVPLVFDVPRSSFLAPAASSLRPLVQVPVAFAPLAATGLVLWALSKGGGEVADVGGGRSLTRGLHGMKIALPYALLTFAFSFAVHATFAVPDVPGLTVHPEPVAALVWPLALGAVAGFAGGVRSVGPDGETTWDRRIRGVLAGGWRMLWLGLAFSFLGLLAVAVSKPDETTRFVAAAFSGGTLQGALNLGLTFSVVPNMAAWILFPAMGGCTGLSGAFSTCLLSYTRVAGPATLLAGPLVPAGAVDVPGPPPGYFLFLLAPLIAAVAGGEAAARRGSPGGRFEAAALGAGAGVVFAALSSLVILLSQLAVGARGGVTGYFAEGTLRAGPEIVAGVLVAAAWGVAGGAVGGVIGWARTARRLARPAEAASGPSTEDDQAEPASGGHTAPAPKT